MATTKPDEDKTYTEATGKSFGSFLGTMYQELIMKGVPKGAAKEIVSQYATAIAYNAGVVYQKERDNNAEGA